jgi:hypothetical protein
MTPPDPSRRKPHNDSTATALLIGMVLAVGVTAAASFSAAGSGALQETLRTLGFGRDTEIQAEQRKQAAVLADFERIINRMDNEIGGLSSRVARTAANDRAVSERLSHIDSGIAALTGEMQDVRARSGSVDGEGWHKPIEHLNTAVSGARGDIITLRSSLDAYDQARRNDIGAPTAGSSGWRRRSPHPTPRRRCQTPRRPPQTPRAGRTACSACSACAEPTASAAAACSTWAPAGIRPGREARVAKLPMPLTRPTLGVCLAMR